VAGGWKRFVVGVARSFEGWAGAKRPFRHVAVETSDATRMPVRGVIKLRVWASTHGAEERVLLGVEDDADVPAPNDKVASLGFVHAGEIDAADVEIIRSDVLEGKASLFVNVVNEMGTIRFGIGVGVHRGNGGQNLSSFRFGDGTRPGRMR